MLSDGHLIIPMRLSINEYFERSIKPRFADTCRNGKIATVTTRESVVFRLTHGPSQQCRFLLRIRTLRGQGIARLYDFEIGSKDGLLEAMARRGTLNDRPTPP